MWEGNNNYSAQLDHCITRSRIGRTTRERHTVTTEPGMAHSDHRALLTCLPDEYGGWNKAAAKKSSPPRRLDLTELGELGLVLEATTRTHLEQLGENPALHQVEEAMRAAAEEVLGYKPPPSGRKPFKDKTTRTAQEEVKAARALLKRLKANTGATDDLMEQIIKVTGWECPADTVRPTREVLNRLLGEELRKTITVTRREIAKRVQETQRKNLTEACKKKRHTLDHGKGAIQRAMGKSCQYDTIEELSTRHPDTARLRVTMGSEPTANQICGTVEKKLGITVQVSTSRQEQSTDLILNIQPKERWRIPEILHMCQEEKWHIEDLHCEHNLATEECDVLATITQELGNEGRAKSQQCPGCHNNHTLCTLAARGEQGEMEAVSYCTECKLVVQEEQNEACYEKVPWDKDYIQANKRIPDAPVMRL